MVSTAATMRGLADHVEELERVRNHASLLADMILADDLSHKHQADEELYEAAQQLAIRIERSKALWARVS